MNSPDEIVLKSMWLLLAIDKYIISEFNIDKRA